MCRCKVATDIYESQTVALVFDDGANNDDEIVRISRDHPVDWSAASLGNLDLKGLIADASVFDGLT